MRDFLDALFRELNTDTEAVSLTQLPLLDHDVPPVLTTDLSLDPTTEPTYVCISSVDPDGGGRRKREHLQRLYAIVLDDIGTKATAPEGVEPHWILETSQGNFQYGYAIEPWDVTTEAGQSYADRCIEALALAGHSDPGARGCYRIVRVPGSLHRTGFNAVLQKPFDTKLERLPLSQLMKQLGVDPVSEEARQSTGVVGQSCGLTAEEVHEILNTISPTADVSYDDWLTICIGLRRISDPWAYDLWHAWSSQSAQYDKGEADAKWESVSDRYNGVTFASIMHLHEQARREKAQESVAHLPAELVRAHDAFLNEKSEENAKEFVAEGLWLDGLISLRRAGEPAEGEHWLQFESGIWRKATRTRVMKRIIYWLKGLAGDDKKLAKNLYFKTRTVVALMHELSLHERVQVDPSLMDRNTNVIGTDVGVIDLVKGKLLDADRELYVSRVTGVAPYLDVDFEDVWSQSLFKQTIDEIFEDQPDTIRTMQMLMGSILSGGQGEDIFTIWYGPTSANGKSLLARQLELVFGHDYCTQITELAFKGDGDQHQLASTQGKRFVHIPELPSDFRPSEAILKRLTSEEELTIRPIYRKQLVVRRTFRVVLTSNNIPIFREDDQAVRRRKRFVEFNQQFLGARQDNHRGEKLRKELPLFFRWLIEGHKLWLANGGRVEWSAQCRGAVEEAEQDLLSFEDWFHGYYEIVADDVSNPLNGTELCRLYNEYLLGMFGMDERDPSYKQKRMSPMRFGKMKRTLRSASGHRIRFPTSRKLPRTTMLNVQKRQ